MNLNVDEASTIDITLAKVQEYEWLLKDTKKTTTKNVTIFVSSG